MRRSSLSARRWFEGEPRCAAESRCAAEPRAALGRRAHLRLHAGYRIDRLPAAVQRVIPIDEVVETLAVGRVIREQLQHLIHDGLEHTI